MHEQIEEQVQRHQRAERQRAVDHAVAADGQHDDLAEPARDVVGPVHESDELGERELDVDPLPQDRPEALLLTGPRVERLDYADACECRLERVVRPRDRLLLAAIRVPQPVARNVEHPQHERHRQERQHRQLGVAVDEHRADAEEHARERIEEAEDPRARKPRYARVLADVVCEARDEVAGAEASEERVVLREHRLEQTLAHPLLDDQVHPLAQRRVEADDEATDDDKAEDRDVATEIVGGKRLAFGKPVQSVDDELPDQRERDRDGAGQQRPEHEHHRESAVPAPVGQQPLEVLARRQGDGRQPVLRGGVGSRGGVAHALSASRN